MFDYLTEGLTSPALGFKQSQTDLSLFFNEQTGAIIICYVDNCLIFCRGKRIADELIANLRKNFILTDERELGTGSAEDEISAYFGVQITQW